MKPPPVFHLPEDLPPKTAMALLDLLNTLTDALWQQYETELVALITQQLDTCPDSQQAFDFNDDIPF